MCPSGGVEGIDYGLSRPEYCAVVKKNGVALFGLDIGFYDMNVVYSK